MEVVIEIQTNDRTLQERFFDKANPSLGDQIDIDRNTKAVLRQRREYRLDEVNQLLEIAISFASGVSIGIVSNWLYDKLKGSKAKIKINHKEITVSENHIKAVLTEIIRE